MAGRKARLNELGPQVLGAVKAGLSLVDASRQAGISERTVKNWRLRGEREPDSAYGAFARALKEAQEGPQVENGRMTLEELHVVVARTARKGSTQAQKLMWEMLRYDDGSDEAGVEADPLAGVDEVAARRQARAVA